jgi:hypothetical protein
MEGEGHAVPIGRAQVLWPLALRASAEVSSAAEMTAPSKQHGLLPAQARVQAARLRKGYTPARVPPGAARTVGGRPPAPHPGLLAYRHLLADGQPAEDGQHGSQPGVRTGQTVGTGAQGLPLWFGRLIIITSEAGA